ncbi:OLC1v1026534C1 [Oldenlandia corymbosa var. corymbosa]|uniref:OLC1v1026534C1 n=1 Tax=Oldenlandia corymbosa var. corymbosa TaxID=529605 RepID=A0AAV1C998_OLDCO|nr:OLC1v1026534C1 [Oldenlandia corymbosa var. corymbosa]
MGTELVRTRIKEENMEIPSIPPGFESLVPFSLKKVELKETKLNHSPLVNGSESQTISLGSGNEHSDEGKTSKTLRRRPWINYGQVATTSGDESEPEQNPRFKPPLPKGVIRGCGDCPNCQKVTAKWHPDEASRPDLEDVPVFHPSEEEFEDTIKYIASIRPKAEAYGICRIVPPPSWKPPCPLKQKNIWENSKFATRVQRIDKLQNRQSMNKILKVNHQKRRKKRRCIRTAVDNGNGNGDLRSSADVGMCESERFGFEPGPEVTLSEFQSYADDFKAQYFRKVESIKVTGEMTVTGEHWEPSVEDIEGEYWRMVEKPTEEIEVLYGADLETGEFGSGFPKDLNQLGSVSDEKYVKSGWNLNNFPRLPGSVLSYEASDISGVLVPWLYIGMCFSSFCWHVEDHHLYSLNYMHWGAPKVWYGVPGADALKLEEAMRKHLPDLFEEQPDLLHKLVTQLSPSILKSEGVPVYRCIQNPGEFVLTFPRAYHAGFNSGFNCAEAVNVAPVDWLPHGQKAIELYSVQGRKTSISHDKLLLGAAREAVKAHWELNLLRKNTPDNLRWRDVCGIEGILSRALKSRVDMEKVKREFLCNSSQALKMESSFDATSERECSVCFFDLHLSAAGCHNCSPDKYACLNHAKDLCSCSWGAKFFLFRYEINELNMLVEALEGKLSAIYRWARQDLGLALTSSAPKENSHAPGHVNKVSPPLDRGLQQGLSVRPAVSSVQDQKPKENAGISNNLMAVVQKSSVLKEKPTGDVFSSDKIKMSSPLSSNVLDANSSLQSKKVSQPDKIRTSSTLSNNVLDANCSSHSKKVMQPDKIRTSSTLSTNVLDANSQSKKVSQPDDITVAAGNQSSKGNMFPKSETKSVSFQGKSDVILLLSDDEEEELTEKPTGGELDTSKKDSKEQERIVSQVNNPASVDPTKSALQMTIDFSPECRQAEGAAPNKNYFDPNQQDHVSKGLGSANGDINSGNKGACGRIENPEAKLLGANETFVHPRPCNGELVSKEDGQMKLEMDANSRPMDSLQHAAGNAYGSQSNLDRYYRQRGPRIAKVIRRFNCNVEPLEYGKVSIGKLWCDSRAIYPKGFRSRVKYINVLDPTNMCYYVSEILDVGKDGPLFMVSLEDSPGEVFVHSSAARCWEMVRERVNQEIARQHKLGKPNLHPLQPPGSLDGIEMFGFSSPEIIQVIQAMDQKRVCTEYWKSRPLMQIPPQHSKPGESLRNPSLKTEAPNDHQEMRTNTVPTGGEAKISSLFKKGSPDELHALYLTLNNPNSSTTNKSLVTRLLMEEIQKRVR